MALSLEEDGELANAMMTIRDENLRGWNYDFISDVRQRFLDEEANIFISGRMWVQIRRIRDDQ